MTDDDLVDQRYYFDANAFIKYYTKEPGSLQISRLVSNAKPILISPLTLIESILLQYARRFSIGTNDALHLAILQTLNHQAIMVTSDGSMQHVCERLQIPFSDPEKTI
jgi:predicted nucleic acid-binding protein